MDIVVYGLCKNYTDAAIQEYLGSLTTGMHLKGVVNAKSDLPATASNGDEYGINTPTHHFAVWIDAISGSNKWFEFEIGGGEGKTYNAKDASVEVDNIADTIGVNISAASNNSIVLKDDGLFVNALADWIELTGYGTGPDWHDGGTLTAAQKDLLLASELNYIWLNGMHRLTFRYRDNAAHLATYASSDDYKTHTIEINTSTLAWRYKHEYLATQADLSSKQDKLIAGKNIKIGEDGKTISAIVSSLIDDTKESLTTTWSSTLLKTKFDALMGVAKVYIAQTKPETADIPSIWYVGTIAPFDIWMYANNSEGVAVWEKVGTTSIDLSNYYTKTETDEKFLAKEDATIVSASTSRVTGASEVKSIKINETNYNLSGNDPDSKTIKLNSSNQLETDIGGYHRTLPSRATLLTGSGNLPFGSPSRNYGKITRKFMPGEKVRVEASGAISSASGSYAATLTIGANGLIPNWSFQLKMYSYALANVYGRMDADGSIIMWSDYGADWTNLGIYQLEEYQLVKSECIPVDNATLENDYSNKKIRVKDLGITTAKLANASVTEGKLASNVITYAKLASSLIATIISGTPVDTKLASEKAVYDAIVTLIDDTLTSSNVKTYSIDKIMNLIHALTGVVVDVVSEKPTTGELNHLYYVGPKTKEGSTATYYELWLWANKVETGTPDWTSLNTSEIDLSNFYTKDKLYTKEEIEDKLLGYIMTGDASKVETLETTTEGATNIKGLKIDNVSYNLSGGSNITLNGQDKSSQEVSIYTPETYGAEGTVPIAHGEGVAPTWMALSEANVTYYDHNIVLKDSDTAWINFKFTNTVKKPYSEEEYGSAAAADKAIAKALYDLGHIDANHSIIADGTGSNRADFPGIYGNNEGGTCYRYITGTTGGWGTGSWVHVYDTVIKSGGSKNYSSGTGVEVDVDGKISATQHTKIYLATITAGSTSVNVTIDANYNIISHIAKDNDDEVIVDVNYTSSGATFSIREALDHDISILVTAINSPDATIVLGCPFPVGSVYTSIGSSNPSTIWANTTWSQLADGQFLMNTTNDDILNTQLEEELPNVKCTGPWIAGGIEVTTGVALDRTGTGKCKITEGNAHNYNQITLNLSKSNPTYKDNGKVRPKSLACKMWVRTA